MCVVSFVHQLIPLSKQLSNLCGHLWNRTFRGVRSERVEYLLLHEFHKLKYIVPEKTTAKERQQQKEEDV